MGSGVNIQFIQEMQFFLKKLISIFALLSSFKVPFRTDLFSLFGVEAPINWMQRIQ